MENVEKIMAIQTDYYERLEKAYSNYKKSPKERLTTAYLETRIDTLEKYWKEFKSGHEKLITAVTREERKRLSYFTNEIFDKFEELYYTYKGEMKTVLEKLLPEPVKCNLEINQSSAPKGNDVKLPRVTIPTFSGDYTEWRSFNDLFLALIHKNENLEDVQRLHYLKSNLKGDAEILLRQFAITGENYAVAWSVLKERYDNKRFIANSVFKKFFGQRALLHESSYGLKQLLDTSVECLNALKHLGLPTKHWDAIVNYIITSKLDAETRKQWEETTGKESSDTLPDFETLKSFLHCRFRTLEMVESANKSTKIMKPKTFHTTTTGEIQCAFCKKPHYIFNCQQFCKLPIEERYNFVQKTKLCFNCLIPNHNVVQCKRQTACQICKRKHHSLLHRENISAEKKNNTQETIHNNRETEVSAHTSTYDHKQSCQTMLLATALVDVIAPTGTSHVFRALIDQGSEASFVTSRVVDVLGLKKSMINGVVSGVGEMNNLLINHMVDLEVRSRYNTKFCLDVKAFVLKSLTRRLPAREVQISNWPQLKTMNLADPSYYTPGRIDILLGADVFGRIIFSGLLKGPGNLIAQNTHLGWILSGNTKQPHPSARNSQYITSLHIRRNVKEDNSLLRKFWEIETEFYTNKKLLTKEEEKCEEIYNNTTTRDETGRYTVYLPLKQSVEDTVTLIGDTREQAVRRFEHLERKLDKNEELKKEYTNVIHEYLEMGHMKKVQNDNKNIATYLPHHAIIRADKATTKLRVVFDASAKGSNGWSLNESMMIGPTLQPDLRHLIIRWRSYKFCIVGDIIKMYRQVNMTPNHTNLQRIVWRNNRSEKIESYDLLTVTFGTAAAPYLAVRTLHQLADDEVNRYSSAAPVIKKSFYMDDFMYGDEDLSKLKNVCCEMNQLLKDGGFEMQKWSSNSEEILKYLQKDKKDMVDSVTIKLDQVMKILGLTWDMKDDAFKISVNLPRIQYPVTKRSILSDVASLFDPFGWLSPVIITAKVMIQKLWLCNLEWDDELPYNLVDEWLNYRRDLVNLQGIKIPRWMKMTSYSREVQLHGFADASSIAYAAVVYARVIEVDGTVNVTIIASKTKVAPLKQLTVPRLELCAAVLLAKLLHDISDILQIPKERVFAWTDSMVVLSWLQSQPNRWQVFVGNRVSEILQVIDNNRWRHVQSVDNPADLASRGVKASVLTLKDIWWSGPEWLKDKQVSFKSCIIPQTNLESKKSHHIALEERPIWERFSSLPRMLRVLSYCIRFSKIKEIKEKENFITFEEMNDVMQRCIKYYQRLIFEEELEGLKKEGKVKARSSLISLTPMLDKNGLIRVGGRLELSSLTEDSKHPYIIPNKQHITTLIIREGHLRTFHGGILQTMTFIRSRYWVIGLKSAVKHLIRNCTTCVKLKARVRHQLMGQLPSARVTPHRPFLNTGVDYAGPVHIRTSKGRGHQSTKGYICLFVCLSTRAVHLEAVTDLTSQAFLASFRRFVARRGHCAHLWSDNGTNFVGAARELKIMFEKGKSNEVKKIAQGLANDGTTWHFIPPKAPNFGGLWEAGVKSVKKHLTRINMTSKLTYEEFATLLAQIEACLNSRPICQMDDTLETLTPLTPGHFLIGEPIIGVPDVEYEHKNMNLLTRWQMLQKMTQDFWKRWKSEYLNTLQQRHKWKYTVSPPNIGDIVVIKEDDLPPAKWLLGKVKQLHPGPDNLVRVISVQCKGNNVIQRPLSKLVILPKISDVTH